MKMYYGTLFITLVMAVSTLSRSSSLHNLRKTYPAERATPQECDQSPEELQESLTSKELPTISLDDAGVYFVPSDVITFQTQFTDLSFLISNPMNYVSKAKTSRTKKEFQSKKDFHDESSEQAKTYNDKETYKRDYSDINENPPLYLDLDVPSAAYFERSTLQENTFIDDFGTTEHALDECLDLHVLDYTRKYGIVEEFKEFWKSSNLKKYDNLTNSDLNDRMQKYCSNPEFIVEQSFRDIKGGVLKRKADNRGGMSDSKNKESNRIHEANKELTSTISPLPSDFESLLIQTDLPSTINKSMDNQFVTTYYDDTDSTITNLNTEMTESGGFVVTTEKRNQFYNSDNPLKSSKIAHEGISKNNHFDMDTVGAEIILVTDNYNKITFYETNNETNLDETTSVTPTSTTYAEDFFLKNSFDEINVLTENTLTTPILPTGSRNKYEENDIKIPKLTTKECKNNTVISLIDGIEVLPSNDFKNHKTAQDQSLDNYSIPNTNQLTINNADRDPIVYDREYITGNIFFGTSKELIPIRFQQTDGGKINLSIDGNSLCSKLFGISTEKSHLFATLCKLHQNMPRKNTTNEH